MNLKRKKCNPEGGMGWGMGGRLEREGIYIHVLMADSSCCTAEINTILQNNYPPIKKFLKIRCAFLVDGFIKDFDSGPREL